MKKLILPLLLSLVLFYSVIAKAQKKFSGIIEYTISYPELDEFLAQQYPQKAILIVQDKKSQYEVENFNPNFKYIQISDSETKSIDFLYENFFENNYHIKITPEEVNDAISTFPKLNIKKVSTKEKIAGIKVKKVILSLTESDETITEELYYHPKANGESFTFFRYFKDIKYLPLKFTLYDNGQKAVYEAVKLTPQKMSAGMFKIDKKFLHITYDELEDIYYQQTTDFDDYEEPVEAINEEYIEIQDDIPSLTEIEETHTIIEDVAEFPGGELARFRFLSNNLRYPQLAREKKIQGTVYLEFFVEPDGSLTDIKVIKGIGGGCDEEALRVTSIMPKWKPATQKGKAVRIRFNMAIKFVLD